MTKLIVNADDFGLSEGVNYGIVSAFKNGIVKSTTAMVNMPAFKHGVELLKENQGLGCGVHLTLSLGKPVLNDHKTIVDENGNFHRRITNELVSEKFDLEEVYREFCCQIDTAMEHGVNISHLDSHHHVHTLASLKPVIEKIVNKYELPIRGGFEEAIDYDNVIALIDSFYNENVTEDYFKRNIDKLKEFDKVDLMSHPAFIDKSLYNATSYSLKRMDEYEILISDSVKDLLEENNIVITNYKNV